MNKPYAWLQAPAYGRLPERFGQHQAPAPVSAPTLLFWNAGLAAELGLPAGSESGAAELIGGGRGPQPLQSLATAYAGHQFGQFVPQLGDGRALLLGDIESGSGARFELQLKGSGRTAFSRGGDGRAALGPVLREVIVSEAMHALGIPSTRSLGAVASGEQVQRERPLPGGVLARLAASHVRVGSFQYFACRGDRPALVALSDWCIARHYPHCADQARPALALLQCVIESQAKLIAQWMAVGFVHGVMNTDNMTISGETIDYGPCAFLDEYQANKVFSSIDRQGRYAYRNQPAIAQWNLARLAECLLPLIDDDENKAIELATEALQGFVAGYEAAWLQQMAGKLGLLDPSPDDVALMQEFLEALQAVEADYTQSFRALILLLAKSDGELAAESENDSSESDDLPNTPAMAAWRQAWLARLDSAGRSRQDSIAQMRRSNPAVIPRNHQVEAAIAAAYADDFAPFRALLRACCRPFEASRVQQPYMQAPAPEQRVQQTFCGT